MYTVPITVALGDGIGPEIMESVLHILRHAKARLRIDLIEIGQKLYEKNYTSGISEEAWGFINSNKILLKAPITTPQGGGYKSLNVTLRKALGLYANVRPAVSYYPFIKGLHKKMDVVIIRENEEDLYAGIEYRSTHNLCESVKLISKTGCEKIINYAFEYAVNSNRRKVTCFSKDNIMKFSDGLFHKVFDEIAKKYPQVQNEHYIVDIGTAKLTTQPNHFDVIVTSNLYGDIISDVAAEMSGSVGLAGSANIGTDFAMFEAIHGSAPDIANQNIANPSGLLNAAVMMLNHIKQYDVATNIENAWKKTIEDGVHTADIFNSKSSKKQVNTSEFTEEVISRLGHKPLKLPVSNIPNFESSADSSANQLIDSFVNKPVVENNDVLINKDLNNNDSKHHSSGQLGQLRKLENGQSANLESTNQLLVEYSICHQERKKCVGVDIYLSLKAESAHDIFDKINTVDVGDFKLHTISSMGLKLWPRDKRFIIHSDCWCCRFLPDKNAGIDVEAGVNHSMIAQLITNIAQSGIEFTKTVSLYEYDGQKGYSLSQGE